MKESTKSIARRLRDPRYIGRFFVGNGVDIGGKPDPLSLHVHVLPLITKLRIWDLEDGDAQFMLGVAESEYDFVYSSHTLEHMVDPYTALSNWFRVLKPGGHLIVSIPDEDLYEQGNFVDSFNRHHKHTFTISKEQSWSPKSINVTHLIASLGSAAQIITINLEDTHYHYDFPRFDQTRSPLIESAIEFVVRKRHAKEIEDSGRLSQNLTWPMNLRPHFEQYSLDQKAAAEKFPEPFGETK
jgi:SAM-dependent methyltransferase